MKPRIDTPGELAAVKRTVAVLKSKVVDLQNGSLSPIQRQLDAARRREEENLRKRDIAESALADSEARYREVIDSAREVIFQLDLTGKIRLLSPSWSQLSGYGVDESIGRSALDFAHPEDQREVRERLDRVFEGGEEVRHEFRLLRKDGVARWVRVTASPSRRGGGSATGAAGTLDDVTPRHLQDALSEIGRAMDLRILEGMADDGVRSRVCDDLVTSMRYCFAWIGLKEPDGIVRIAAHAGRGMDPLLKITIRWDGTVKEMGPGGIAVRTGQTQVRHVASHSSVLGMSIAAAVGAAQVVAIPLLTPTATLGVLCVATSDKGGLEADHVRALESFAGRVSMALQLAEHHSLLAVQGAAMRSSADALIIMDPGGRIGWVNPAFERMSGYSRTEAVGESRRLLRASVHGPVPLPEIWKSVLAGKTWRGEVINRRKDGGVYVVTQTVTPLLDERGVVTHVVAAQEDITGRRRAEEQIQHMAHHDALTDLPNRFLFRERVEVAVAESVRTSAPLALFFIDLDGFKLINDTLGHPAGDDLLREIARRLTEHSRDGDVVARFGGDEFTVLLQNIGTTDAVTGIARRMLQSIARPVRIADQDVAVTGSIGIAMCPEDAVDADALMKRADVAMYCAKEAGRNGYSFYATDRVESAASSFTIHAGLRHALERGELSLHYQPEVNAADGRVVGVEALLRWTSPELGTVSPVDFIPVAEETGLIVEIDRWVLGAACAQVAAWRAAGVAALRVAVNVSGMTMRHGELFATVDEALAEARLDPDQLEIELTEGVVMRDVPGVIGALAGLHDRGVRIALDDFGTGYSSLASLKLFRIDVLKIDRSFVTGLPTNKDDVAIARLIVGMAQTLRMVTVAEGVETSEQARFLKDIGCKRLQGYFFSRAVSADKIPGLLARRTAGSLAPLLAATG